MLRVVHKIGPTEIAAHERQAIEDATTAGNHSSEARGCTVRNVQRELSDISELAGLPLPDLPVGRKKRGRSLTMAST